MVLEPAQNILLHFMFIVYHLLISFLYRLAHMLCYYFMLINCMQLLINEVDIFDNCHHLIIAQYSAWLEVQVEELAAMGWGRVVSPSRFSGGSLTPHYHNFI